MIDVNKASSGEACSSSSENSSSGSQPKESTIVRQENVWLMYQLIFIFYESSSHVIKSQCAQFKPISPFMIIYENMSSHGKRERIKFIAIAHEYLAR